MAPSITVRIQAMLLMGVICFHRMDATCRFGGNRGSERACLASTRRGRRKPLSSSGFGAKPTAIKANKAKTSLAKKGIYSMPALYDLAFGYRNYEEETRFLVGEHQRLCKNKSPTRVLELAAGPARHSILALQQSLIQSATAIDLSPEMVKYGQQVATDTLDPEKLAAFTYLEDDMCSFGQGSNRFDTAWILLGSLQHLTTNDQVISCFQSAHRVLASGGTLILELPHPRETFSLVECTRNGWEVPLEDENGGD